MFHRFATIYRSFGYACSTSTINWLERIAIVALVAALKFYRLLISPLLGPHCRFEPSCSVYAQQALQQRGLMYGSWLSMKRLLKCHPWGAAGHDPVPPKQNTESKKDASGTG